MISLLLLFGCYFENDVALAIKKIKIPVKFVVTKLN